MAASTHGLIVILAINAQKMTNALLGLQNWDLAILSLAIPLFPNALKNQIFPIQNALPLHLLHLHLLAHQLAFLQATTSVWLLHWFKQLILVLAKLLQRTVMTILVVLLILAMQQLVFAKMSLLHPLNVFKAVPLMLNVENMLSTIICMKIVNLLLVTPHLELAFLKMIPRLIARSAKPIVSQIPTVTMQNVFGLEIVINANTLLSPVMMANLAPSMHAIHLLVNAQTNTIAPLNNVTLTSIALPGQLQILNTLQIVWFQPAMFHKDPVQLNQTHPALQHANKILIAHQLNSVQFVILLPALVNQIIANSIRTALILILQSGTTVEFALLMVKNAVLEPQNVLLTLDAMIKILAQKISACLSMVSAETLQDVTTIMNVPTTFALLLLTENPTLALILLVVALKMQLLLMPTLSYSTTNKKSSGWENVIRRKVV
jgi:hypothetical protein